MIIGNSFCAKSAAQINVKISDNRFMAFVFVKCIVKKKPETFSMKFTLFLLHKFCPNFFL